MSLVTKKIHVSRDFIFHESIFPFHVSSTASFPSVFTSLPSIDDSDCTKKHFDQSNLEEGSGAEKHLSPGGSPSSSLPLSSLHPNSESLIYNSSSPVYHSQPYTNAPVEPIPGTSRPTLRRSCRHHTLPAHLPDYIYTMPTLKSPDGSSTQPSTLSLNAFFSHHNHVSLNSLAPDNQLFVQIVCTINEPTSYEEAALLPAWQAAMKPEFEAIHADHTWDMVSLPVGKNAVGCKWVYKIKHKADGCIERFNARLVVKGYTQQEGIDYTKTLTSCSDDYCQSVKTMVYFST